MRVEGKENKTKYFEETWPREADPFEDIRARTKGRVS